MKRDKKSGSAAARRHGLGMGLVVLGLAGGLAAQAPAPASGGRGGGRAQPCAVAGNDNAFVGITTTRLWAGAAPEAKGDTCFDIPTLTEVAPFGAGNGTAVLIFPGGAYLGLASTLEGSEVADWFAARGVRAYVVAYRLASHGYLLPVPLLDARRAIQTVRAGAAEEHVDPNRIGVVGFSAGGHLAALASTQFAAGDPAAADPIERVSSRPDFAVLGYPWIGAISTDTSHLSYCKLFNVMDQCDALAAKYSPDLFVTAQTPPTFIYATTSDQTVPIQQELGYYGALLKAGVSVEMHIFAHGPHGTGLGSGDPVLDQWPGLLESWLRQQGLLDRSAALGPPPGMRGGMRGGARGGMPSPGGGPQAR